MARELDREAARTRASVPPMLGRVEAARWESSAATAMRSRARECAGDLRRIARLYDVAAACVRRHADRVEHRTTELRLEARAAELAMAGAHAVVRGARGAGEAVAAGVAASRGLELVGRA